MAVFAKLRRIAKPRPMWQVVFSDPLQFNSKGKPKEIREHFSLKRKKAAEARQRELNKQVVVEGTAGIAFDADLRADAVAARKHLDAVGHTAVGLLSLAQRYTSQVTSGAAASLPITPEIEAFLKDKETIDELEPLSLANLKTRVWLWVDLAGVKTVADVTRDSVEVLRRRPVSSQTRKNDLNAVSSFCSWLFENKKLDHQPLAGMKRPRTKTGKKKKPTFTLDQCKQVLAAAATVNRLGTIAVMIFAGARPSELSETKLLYRRHPLVKIQGGKLQGRANRTVPMGSALRAFLASVGNPTQVPPLSRKERETIAKLAGIKWIADICRHTYMSYRLPLVDNDATVAREGGTSEEVIYRHYHDLKEPAEARKWARLRP